MANVNITVDIVLFTIINRRLHLLLIRRLEKPFVGRYALPGGVVLKHESPEESAIRELREETGVENVFLEQLYTFGEPKRDPSGRVITIAYYALAPHTQSLHSTTDAADAAWFPLTELPPLAFDHRKIVDVAHARLRNKLDYTNVGFELLGPKFTISDLQMVHEAVLGRALDKRNFRRRLSQQNIVVPLEEWLYTGRRPAGLYRFRSV